MSGTVETGGTAALTADQFNKIVSVVRELTGIHLDDSKRALVSSRMSRRVRAAGAANVEDYFEKMKSTDDKVEQAAFISAFTTNMSHFNRESHHFEFFSKNVLPGLIERAGTNQTIRIWSAGCSSGEEPYGLAFCILDQVPRNLISNFKVLATDIDIDILRAASVGEFTKTQLNALSEKHRSAYFKPVKGDESTFKVSHDARNLIAFRLLNLHDDWPMTRKFDVIMCRNVSIYFDDETNDKLWERFVEQLYPHSTLFLGHSEYPTKLDGTKLNSLGSGIFERIAESHETNSKIVQIAEGA